MHIFNFVGEIIIFRGALGIFELIKDKMTQDLLTILCTKKLHFCGETISKKDQKHGARVDKEGLVTTMVAKGHWINILENIKKWFKFFRFIKISNT